MIGLFKVWIVLLLIEEVCLGEWSCIISLYAWVVVFLGLPTSYMKHLYVAMIDGHSITYVMVPQSVSYKGFSSIYARGLSESNDGSERGGRAI